MIFTPKLITLVAVGAAILLDMVMLAKWETTQALLFLFLYNGALVLLFIADWLLTVKPAVLCLARICEHRLSLGADNPIIIKVENRSQATLTVWVKDEPPVNFHVGNVCLRTELQATSSAKLRYTLNPVVRGDYYFGHMHCRYRSRLGLFWRQVKVSGENEHIRVYPNIREIQKYQLLLRQGQCMVAGMKRSVVIGRGTDFESIRDYQVDDEYRRINWGATARRGGLATNCYTVDKSQNILLVVDAGRMMTGAVHDMTKLDHAVNAALLLGYVGVTKDDKVGLLAFADQVKLYIPPGRGQPQLHKLLAGLYNLQPEVVESDYREACQYLGIKHRKRSLICLFSDLIDEEISRELITCVAALTRSHLVMCISLLDSSLISQANKVPANSQEVYEQGVARAVLYNQQQAVARLKNEGVVVVSVPPEELSVALVNKYLELKLQSRL